MNYLITIKKVLINSGQQFVDDRVLKLSAALSYYTLFSLSPMLMVIMGLGNIFFAEEIIQGHVYEFIYNTLGKSSATQIQEILRNQRLEGNSIWATTIGFLTLFIGATSMFGELQDSMNQIWKIELKPKGRIIRLLISRILSFTMVIIIGLIMATSFVLDFLLEAFSKEIKNYLDLESIYFAEIANYATSVILLFVLFTLLFKLLPDVKLSFKQIIPGAVFTTVIFFAGKFLTSFYLTSTATASSYGSAGSIVIILIWVYFSSVFVYFGAIFTRQYLLANDKKIQPNVYAYKKNS